MGDVRVLLEEAAPAPHPVDIPAIRRGAARRRRHRRLAAGGVLVAGVVVAGVAVLRPPDPPAARVDAVADTAGAPKGDWVPLAIPGVVDNEGHVSVPTPEGVFVWVDGYAAVLDAATGYVSRRPTPPGPSPVGAAIAWTGSEVVVFGGRTPEGNVFTGSAYNSRTRQWRTFTSPLSARTPMASAWTGTELLIFGSVDPATPAEESAAFDPATDTWRPLADTPPELTPLAPIEGAPGESGRIAAVSMWTGDRLVVVATARGRTNATAGSFAFSYNPSNDQWSRLPDPGLSHRVLSAAWTGTQVVAWDDEHRAVRWAPNDESWQRLPDLPFDSSDCAPGGAAGPSDTVLATYCDNAAIFDERLEEWVSIRPPFSVAGTVHGDERGYTVIGSRSARIDLLARCPGSVHPFERPPLAGETGDGLPQSGSATRAAAEQVASERAAGGVHAKVRAVNGRAWTRAVDNAVTIVEEVIHMVEVEVPTARNCATQPAFSDGVPMSVVYRRR